jgi:hypothetical protein
MKLPLLGQHYPSYIRSNNNSALVNFYLEQDQTGKDTLVALPRPGLEWVMTVPTFPNRGSLFVPQTNQFPGGGFVVNGNVLYALGSGTYQAIGSLTTSTGFVKMTYGVGQLAIVDGSNLYVYNLSTGAFTVIPGTVFNSGPIDVCFMDNYIIVFTRFTYYWSAINDATQFDSLDFTTPEGKPDSIRGALALNNEIRIFGDRTLEIHLDTGDLNQPFRRAGNTFSERGCVARDTIQALDNAAFWLGEDEKGGYTVWRASGFSPTRVSHHALENAMRLMTTVYDAYAWAFVMNGHSFYVLTFPTAKQTWAYDVATNLWASWTYWNGVTEEHHRVATMTYGNGVYLCGDRENGNLYRLKQDVFTDNSATIRRVIRTKPLNADNKRQFFGELVLDLEPGQGLEPNYAPQIMMKSSDDGGFTWNNERFVTAGKIGEYMNRAIWWRNGSAFNRVYEFVFTDPIKWAIKSATIELRIGK